MIRVLIVEDSSLMAKILAAILNTDPQIMVVGTAKDGVEAVGLAEKLKPNLITMDIHMPRMDGLEATKQIMAYFPTPILILSASVHRVEHGVDKVFTALSYGALDVMEKKAFMGDEIDEQAKIELLEKIKLLARIRVISHPLAKIEKGQLGPMAKNKTPVTSNSGKAVGIVASTGGPQALSKMLKALPEKFSAPVFLVQHLPNGFVQGFADWLKQEVPLQVKVAEAGEKAQAGIIYLAPNDKHLKVGAGGILLLSHEAPVGFQRPSGDLLLQSIAEVYGANAMGIVLTGMGSDGAQGLKKIHDSKGFTLAQDEATSIVYGMPKVALELGGVDEIVPLLLIPEKIKNWVQSS